MIPIVCYSGLHEPSGEAESPYGKIDPKKFGDRVYRSSLPEKIQKKKRERFVVSETTMQNKKRRRIPGEESSVLNWREEEGGVYQPKTKETGAAYECMLSLIQHQLCGQPLNIMSAAADEILAVLNDAVHDDEEEDEYVQLEGNVAGIMQMGSGGIDDEILPEADEGMALNVRYIDAYWLQRKKLAEEVLKILAESGDDLSSEKPAKGSVVYSSRKG
ncbi:hypothetical protein KY290_028932 [Solanum tuberosum]|uniref:Uncharacterized protein n=1 Tax=Solanum tuberosum TaxID=4113 RepID=A0ABQ7UJA0_SOLTU|nr:hypothetical protein KY285_027965 [Solanum tuberosum]KAH0749700.1 hypothetical protein KY290_028932 [Solanum tuberosum]